MRLGRSDYETHTYYISANFSLIVELSMREAGSGHSQGHQENVETCFGGVWGGAPAGCGAEPREENLDILGRF